MSRSLAIGVACYPTFGGSGVVATEIGLGLARRGHRVHFVATEVPGRLDPTVGNIWFHRVKAKNYHVFPQPPYTLALTSMLIRVARSEALDLVHAHYAVPHATAAWMAKEILGRTLPVVTTLHGTDITLIGADESYLPVTRHSIAESDALTAPSAFLRDETRRRFGFAEGEAPIEVIPNFVDTDTWRPPARPDRPALRQLLGSSVQDIPVVVHVSNFRPLKRVDRVVEIFARVSAIRPALLLLIGEGPERPAVEAQLRREGLSDRAILIGNTPRVEELVREASVFLLPSETESFGLAALEALASGVPVVCSAVGGLPEVVRDGVTGFLCDPDDLEGMAASVVVLMDDPDLRQAMGKAAREDAVERFRADPILDRYEALYRRLSEGRGRGR